MWGFAGPALNCPSFPPSPSFGCGLGPGLTPGPVGGGTLALAAGTVAGGERSYALSFLVPKALLSNFLNHQWFLRGLFLVLKGKTGF